VAFEAAISIASGLMHENAPAGRDRALRCAAPIPRCEWWSVTVKKAVETGPWIAFACGKTK